jgi:asparagine synthase (glutamine-hydrolysing)
VLFDASSPIYNFLDRAVVSRLVGEHLAGRQNRRLLIWSLLSLHGWCTSFLAKRAIRRAA